MVLYIGTSNFVSYQAAVNYYRPYNPDLSDRDLKVWVNGKINAGEIKIGKPDDLKVTDQLMINHDEGRYIIGREE